MHPTEKKYEIIRLAKKLCARDNPHFNECRYGILSCFDTAMGVTIRIFRPENASRNPPDDLVYSLVRDYDAEKKSVNREMSQFGVGLKGRARSFVEGTWEPKYADETLTLLQQAMVLDLLAEAPEVEGA